MGDVGDEATGALLFFWNHRSSQIDTDLLLLVLGVVFFDCWLQGFGVLRVYVIGGGAAGFFGAIRCAELLGDRGKVTILEKGPDILTKVRISGGGRCNVTHATSSARELVGSYPRGAKSLMGTFSRWGTAETVEWFAQHGVELKTEADGRMFPVTDKSQTVIDALTDAADAAGVKVQTRCAVGALRYGKDSTLRVMTPAGELPAEAVLMASGGTRSKDALRPLEVLAPDAEEAVPSLFTFKIVDERLTDLQGLSVPNAEVKIGKLKTNGPLLITHWGLSGPAILKASAWGARELSGEGYNFQIQLSWLADLTEEDVRRTLAEQRSKTGKRRVALNCPFPALPKRLWERLCQMAGVSADVQWAGLTKEMVQKICVQLLDGRYRVTGKSLNKDEFVTCGGVPLKRVNLKTMESKELGGVFFAGEVLDIDGVTGGFNFQAAWATGRIAAEGIAARLLEG